MSLVQPCWKLAFSAGEIALTEPSVVHEHAGR